MISKNYELNKYGGNTWKIRIDSLFWIFLHESDDESYLIEFKEWKIISYKTHFSFISSENLANTLNKTFNRICDFFIHKNVSVSIQIMENIKNTALSIIPELKLKKNNIVLREDGVYIGCYDGIGVYGNIFKITMIFAFSKDKIYYRDDNKIGNLIGSEVNAFIDTIHEFNSELNVTKYYVDKNKLRFKFNENTETKTFEEFEGIITENGLCLSCNLYSFNFFLDNNVKSVVFSNLDFKFLSYVE